MKFLYNTGIFFYSLGIHLAAPFNAKAKAWVNGRTGLFARLQKEIRNDKPITWFHCASLGEFEMARPVIEKLRAQQAQQYILITFFSPSGYEIRKNYPGADFIFYLPSDLPWNAKKFVSVVKPHKAIFVKYEFWLNYLGSLRNNGVDTYAICSVFRNDQRFFKWYGAIFRKALKGMKHIFVQHKDSQQLLKSIGIECTVAGDTRFDRVYETSQHAPVFPLIEKFKAHKKIVIAGSSWQPEESALAAYINTCTRDVRYIIAPHDISDSHITEILSLLKVPAVAFSKANEQNITEVKAIVIDNIGMLAGLYRYADIALVGGGFSGKLHNILEAAAFGLPVLFGPVHHRFKEATELLQCGGAYVFKNEDELALQLNSFIDNPERLEFFSQMAQNYVFDHRGATEKIMKVIA